MLFGNDSNEFIDRLNQVFLRFRKHNLFLKAKKCYFGYAELDLVGKVLSEKGLQMSQKKIRSVLDFPKSVLAKQLKSFLGTVNYFRDFIRNQSSIVHPLHCGAVRRSPPKTSQDSSSSEFLEVPTPTTSIDNFNTIPSCHSDS